MSKPGLRLSLFPGKIGYIVRLVTKIALLWLIVSGWVNPGLVLAQNSPSYNLDEVFIGPGGTIDAGSDSYGLQGNLGDIGAGESSSASYNLLAGFTTDAEPTLLFTVNTSSVNLGIISETTTGTGTATFSVATYNAQGYVIHSYGDPPATNSYSIPGLANPTASAAGTEQFGINLVENTCPATDTDCVNPFGGNPVQFPDSTFSYGTTATGYNTTNLYKYVEGNTVAQSTRSSGQTNYTVSYLMNATGLSGGGTYTMRHILVATSTF